MIEQPSNFKTVDLGGGYTFLIGQIPEPLLPTASFFEILWQMHPIGFHEIKMYGRLIKPLVGNKLLEKTIATQAR